jgi:hypothetical protein
MAMKASLQNPSGCVQQWGLGGQQIDASSQHHSILWNKSHDTDILLKKVFSLLETTVGYQSGEYQRRLNIEISIDSDRNPESLLLPP